MEKREDRNLETLRKPFQGILNIVRFNWHFFVLAVTASLGLLWLGCITDQPYRLVAFTGLALVITGTLVPLITSFYIYDLSEINTLNWLTELNPAEETTVVNINAGFDETSNAIRVKYPNAKLKVYDFYDPLKHTEISIKRARSRYPSYPGTKSVTTVSLPLIDNEADYVLIFFAAHEIRNEHERISFFKEINRTLRPSGKIIIVEHLRDFSNLLAYNIGFLHFLSHSSWVKSFTSAGLHVASELKITPFISKFVLTKNGNAS